MALSPRLEIRQSQALVMTPQLQQAIKLLQLSNLELNEYVEQELENNPLLERDESQPSDNDAPEGGTESPQDGAQDSATSDRQDDGENAADFAADNFADDTVGDQAAIELDGVNVPDTNDLSGAEGPLDTDFENVYNNDGPTDAAGPPADTVGSPADAGDWSSVGSGGSGSGGDGSTIENTLSRGASLKDHLLEQLNVSVIDPVQRLIGANLIECLDDAGYLTEETAALAERLGCEEAVVEHLLSVLKTFDPAGIFARNLSECLALQLKERDRYDPAMQTLVENLDRLAQHDIPGLMRLCQVDAEDVHDMVSEIRALNPKPGLVYDYEVAQPVIPDVYVRDNPDGGWMVELNTETLPRILVNARYFAKVNEQTKTKDERAYVTECINNANWLVKSLDQRARTILRVSSEIVRQQDAFLAHGVEHLRPLNLRVIAEAIEMHESTVSRVTANKYMATSRGIFELKYFFTSSIAHADGGDAHSAESVRHRLQQLIDSETPDSVLSDDKLVDVMHGCGVDIARRTIAKYREALGIPSSVQRRRMKRMSA